MREETETIRTYYNADPRKEWDRLMKKHPYEKYITVHDRVKKGFVTTADS